MNEQVLDAAESLFYDRGIQAVGMDEIRAASGVSLKRLYQLFASKEALVAGYLERRDKRWRDNLAGYVARADAPPVLAVFDWLHAWFSEPGFRGCAFINSFGELGATSPAVTEIARHHKRELKIYIRGLVDSDQLADQILVLIDGAITVAAVMKDPDVAWPAKAAAKALISG
ncbi:AcrR family transcriptional regulator [Kibdelosporangium banguiense]|uniref:AcrR family transcriptional regulator n=1 Tax=Kibdelosporangium banguiense TaxID=1365924 RepID=A0ABS4T795_9PSEU|nr:TetR/AcrR family transcriptional regulator [Kibdelosporangium banguiense]MBP2320299.1 AcrR family transcriptional regulator [Kibdelosporangium banguiense]